MTDYEIREVRRQNAANIQTALCCYTKTETAKRWSTILKITVLIATFMSAITQSNFLFAQAPQKLSLAELEKKIFGEIDVMIEGLGSDDFLVRQRASEQLLEVGSLAIAPLRAAKNAADQEVRYRANDILKQLLDTDFEQRAKRFLAMDPESNNDCGFQHWQTFSQFAGTTSESRSLLLSIHKNPQATKKLREIDSARSSEGSIDVKIRPLHQQSVSPSVAVYAAEMYRRIMLPQANRVPQGTTLQGSGVMEELTVPAIESNFLSLSPITVQKSEHKRAFLALLTAWLKLELETNPMTVTKIKIISNYQLKAFAGDLAKVLNEPQYPHKQAAIEAIGKIFFPANHEDQLEGSSSAGNDSGVVDAIRKIKPFVLSEEVLLRLPQAETVGPVDVTLGDLAFQLMLNLQEKDPKDFGMSEASGKMLLANNPVFCYKNRAAASESIKKWLAKHDPSQSNADQ